MRELVDEESLEKTLGIVQSPSDHSRPKDDRQLPKRPWQQTYLAGPEIDSSQGP